MTNQMLVKLLYKNGHLRIQNHKVAVSTHAFVPLRRKFNILHTTVLSEGTSGEIQVLSFNAADARVLTAILRFWTRGCLYYVMFIFRIIVNSYFCHLISYDKSNVSETFIRKWTFTRPEL